MRYLKTIWLMALAAVHACIDVTVRVIGWLAGTCVVDEARQLARLGVVAMRRTAAALSVERLKTCWLLCLTACLLGGWSSGGYDQYFSLDSSGNVVCAAPLQVTRLGVGVAPGSYTGTIKQAVNANDGSVKAIEQAWSGTPGESSDAMIWNGTYGIGGSGVSFAIKSYANEIRNVVGSGAPTLTYGFLIDDTTVPAAPAAGYLAVYNETATGLLSVKNSAGDTTALAFP